MIKPDGVSRQLVGKVSHRPDTRTSCRLVTGSGGVDVGDLGHVDAALTPDRLSIRGARLQACCVSVPANPSAWLFGGADSSYSKQHSHS